MKVYVCLFIILLVSEVANASALCKNCYNYKMDKQIGYWNKKNLNVMAQKKCLPDASICYNVNYKTNEYGSRVYKRSGQVFKPNEHFLLFGCSFGFGEGVEAQDTLAYQFEQIMGVQVLNYSMQGTGPVKILNLLKHKRLDHIKSTGPGIFMLKSFHLDRVDNNTVSFWLRKDPSFILDDDKLIRIANPTEAPGLRSKLVNIFMQFKLAQKLLKILNIKYYSTSKKHRETLLLRLLTEAQKQYEEKFKHPLYVFYFSDEYTGQKHESLLEAIKDLNSDAFIDLKNVPRDQFKQRQICVCDGHPTREYYSYVAAKIKKSLSQ